MQWWFVGAAALAGCFIAIQAAANSALRDSLASPWYAAFFSITGTMVCAILFLICLIFAPWWISLIMGIYFFCACI